MKADYKQHEKYFGLIKKNAERSVVIGFNENSMGEAVVTTGVPVRYNSDKVSYVRKRTMSYDRYMDRKMR